MELDTDELTKNGISLEGDSNWQLIINSSEEATDAICVIWEELFLLWDKTRLSLSE